MNEKNVKQCLPELLQKLIPNYRKTKGFHFLCVDYCKEKSVAIALTSVCFMPKTSKQNLLL